MAARFLQAQPACRVHDLDHAVRFYEGLGFEAGYRNGAVHQVLHGGNVTLHLSTIEGGPASCQIVVEGVDELFEAVIASGGEVLFDGIADREWGCRDFTMRDPDGNCITFSEPLGGE